MKRWVCSRQKVNSTDATTVTVNGSIWPYFHGWDFDVNDDGNGNGHDRYYVENSLAALDAPGEWLS
jgi:hypothetical protein